MDFGNFVIHFHPKSPQIGNFVSKITVFDLILALAKNLTTSGRPNEMKRTALRQAQGPQPTTIKQLNK